MTSSRTITVLDAGPLTTVQDLGRPGWAHLGVPRAGALDRPAADLANRLVGNRPEAALLETTMGGTAFTVSGAMTVAVTGARAPVTVGGRANAWAEPIAVPAGATVRVGPASCGLRSYVAFGGGIDVAPVLGSRSTDTLAWVGPPALRAGDVVAIGPATGDPCPVDAVPVASQPAVVTLRLFVGPRADWFTAEALRTLTGSTYAVSSDANRIGLRLQGPGLVRSRTDELPSEGIVLGSVQVPASGQPLVFLNDHPTTGGYPVVGVVHAADLADCAQLRPGDRVRLRTRPGG